MSCGAGREESGRKMEGNGMEDSEERRGDKGELTHAKLPPMVPGDRGSGDRPPPTPRGKGEDHKKWQGPAGGVAGVSSRFN